MHEEATVNGALLEVFRHNAWATRVLLAFCRDLPEERLASAATGTYGGILDTFNHVVLGDARYLMHLTGGGPAWARDRDEGAGLDELETRAEETAQGWERFLSEPVDAERLLILDEGAYEAHAGVLVAQAINHGNAHREQICSILTGLGMEPPDLQGWAYGEATGRGRERTPDPT